MRPFLRSCLVVVGLAISCTEAAADRFQQVCTILRYAGPFGPEFRQVCRDVRIAERVADWGYQQRLRAQPYYNQQVQQLGPRPSYMPPPRPMNVPQAPRMCFRGRCY